MAREVVDRKYPVAKVSARQGIWTYSLYTWVKAVRPGKTGKRASEMLDAKSELCRLLTSDVPSLSVAVRS